MRAVIRIGFNPRTHTGCDDDKPASGNYYDGFNPRTHTGCDVVSDELEQVEKVSIHAPTRGATSYPTNWNKSKKFQSTHPHGVRPIHLIFLTDFILFQSTHPHGVRLQDSSGIQGPLPVSIHAPTRGATPRSSLRWYP